MRVAALYDIHGNLPALEAVLDDVRRARADRIVIGGDVLPGPMPRETLTTLLQIDVPVQFLSGNGDREVLTRMRGSDPETLPPEVRETIRWNARQLDAEHERVLAGWPPTLRIAIPPLGDVLFCHATPRNDADIFTRATPEDLVLPAFSGVDAPVVVCGHTHMQFDRPIGPFRVVNAGSVGMPFGKPGAYWLIVGPAIELRRTDYDLAAAADRIRRTSYPRAAAFAAANVLTAPSEQSMLDAFSGVTLE
jgi:predicted phosphodiesterase